MAAALPSSRTRIGTAEIVGPIMLLMPASGTLRPVTVAPSVKSSEREFLEITTAHAARITVEEVMPDETPSNAFFMMGCRP